MDLVFILGVVLALAGILASIALHEAGHLVPAKIFGVAAPEYSVGFGPRLFARKIGTTVYGARALPIGGFVKLGGMFPPPGPGSKPDGLAAKFWAAQQHREAAWEGRGMWQLKTWQQLVVLLSGPLVNLVLGIGALVVALSLIGTPTVFNTVSEVQDGSPAAAAGLRPGDTITAVDGTATADWRDVSEQVSSAGTSIALAYERDGQAANTQLTTTGEGPVGLKGTTGHHHMTIPEIAAEVGDMVTAIAQSIATFPAKITDLAVTTFTDAPRDSGSPMSMVGVGGLSGEIASTDLISDSAKVFLLMVVLATVNLSLFFFNLLPLPPLDGGRIVTILASSIHRRIAALRGAADPGHLSPAILMPVTYSVVGIYLLVGALTIAADFIEPIRLTQ